MINYHVVCVSFSRVKMYVQGIIEVPSQVKNNEKLQSCKLKTQIGYKSRYRIFEVLIKYKFYLPWYHAMSKQQKENDYHN